ncbi:transmembrane protein 19 isoform X2 [Palaemon carinicauda]|uniref:transmembrane protein 19 isoform X2 n=1 Tax=Palaemon carinicauda TaxID=392227 RepID=UPI0035B676F2
MSESRKFMWLLLISLPVSLIMWLVNAFLSTTSGDVIEPSRWLTAIIMPIAVARWGLSRRSLSISGAATGLVVGFLLTLSSYVFLVNLLVFFVSSSKATKFKSEAKKKFEENFKEGVGVTRNGPFPSVFHSYARQILGGERNWVQVLCNGGVASLMAWFYIMDCGCGENPIDMVYNYRCSWLSIAVLGALACCNGDTWSSEFGTVLSTGDPILITSLQPVPRGTNGGVTAIGLLVSLIGGFVIGLGHYLTLLMFVSTPVLISSPPQWPIVFVGALGGLLGSLIDSVIGATMQYSGMDSEGRIVERPGDGIVPICGSNILDNHAVNLISSLLTAIILPRVALMVM